MLPVDHRQTDKLFDTIYGVVKFATSPLTSLAVAGGLKDEDDRLVGRH